MTNLGVCHGHFPDTLRDMTRNSCFCAPITHSAGGRILQNPAIILESRLQIRKRSTEAVTKTNVRW
jgi:hypothetical protein